MNLTKELIVMSYHECIGTKRVPKGRLLDETYGLCRAYACILFVLELELDPICVTNMQH